MDLSDLRIRFESAEGQLNIATAILVKAADVFRVHHCDIEQNRFGYGINVRQSRLGYVSDCKLIETNRKDHPKRNSVGIGLNESTFRVIAHDCHIEGYDHAIQFGGLDCMESSPHSYPSFENVAQNNRIANVETGFAFFSSGKCVARNNTVLSPERYVIRVLRDRSIADPQQNLVVHNVFDYRNALLDNCDTVRSDAISYGPNFWSSPRERSRSPSFAKEADAAQLLGEAPEFDADGIAIRIEPMGIKKTKIAMAEPRFQHTTSYHRFLESRLG